MTTETWNQKFTYNTPPVLGAFLTEKGWELPLKGTDPTKGLTEVLIAFAVSNPQTVAGSANVVKIVPPANGAYTTGAVLRFKVHFNEAVTVTGTPRLALTLTSGTVYATYVSGSGKNILNFDYTVGANNIDLNGLVIVDNIDLNSGAIIDKGTNPAVNSSLTFTGADTVTSGLIIDAVNRTISSVTPPANGNYVTAATLTFTVNYNQPVNVTGTPRIPLFANNGTTPLTNVGANYVSGSGTSALVFTYVVPAGAVPTGIKVGADVLLNGGTITASSGTAVTVTNTFTQISTTITLN